MLVVLAGRNENGKESDSAYRATLKNIGIFLGISEMMLNFTYQIQMVTS